MVRIEETLDYRDKTVDENGVLINKLGINDSQLLEKAEREITSFKLAKMYLDNNEGSFDVKHYLSIHKYLFDDIYPFAGKIRSEVISKRLPFCLPNLIYNNLERVLKKANIDYKLIKNKEQLVKFIAVLYSDLDIIHPFREGNGRCEREFIRQYVQRIVKDQKLDDYAIDYSRIYDKNGFINAVIKADITCDTVDLEKIISDLVVVQQYEEDKNINNYKKR